jgi:hypothetical protein
MPMIGSAGTSRDQRHFIAGLPRPLAIFTGDSFKGLFLSPRFT